MKKGDAPARDRFPLHAAGGERKAALVAAHAHLYGAHMFRSILEPEGGPSASERWQAASDARRRQTEAWAKEALEKGTDDLGATKALPRARDGGAGAALRVFTDAEWVKNDLDDAGFEVVDALDGADVCYVQSGGANYARRVPPGCLVSWYAYEAALIRKDHLANTLRRAGLERLAPHPTYDLETDLDALLGHMARDHTKLPCHDPKPDPFYILKPYDLGRSIGHCCTNSRHCVLAYADAGGYVAQRYVQDPHTLPPSLGGAVGRKYDVRVVALLRSAAPLELYAHDHVYVRAANEAHDLAHLDDVAVSLTAMHLVGETANHPKTSAFVAAFDAQNGPKRPWASVMADCRDTLRRVFAAAAYQHAGFRDASKTARAAYGCDFILDADLNPLLLEVTFAPAPLWSSADMPEKVPGVANDIFRTLFLGDTANVTRC